MASRPAELHRWIIFLIGCIGSRLIFIIAAKFSGPDVLRYLGYAALIPALGMFYLWLTGSRMTGREAGGKIWWHSWRIAHSVLYFAFAYAAITGDQNAYLYLAADVILALCLFFAHYGFGFMK